jgi:hypothetical protein
MVAPWALGQQASGSSWTAVTTAQVGTGAGLVLLALIGAGLVIGQVAGTLREMGAGRRRVAREVPAATAEPATPAAPAAQPWGPAQAAATTDAGEPNEEALISLAQALANELTQQELSHDRSRATDSRRAEP